MKQGLFNKIIIFIIASVSVALIFTLALPVQAQPDFGFDYAANIGLGNADPRDAAISLIKVMMTFIGLIAVLVILFGGFRWLVSGGDEDKVALARRTITGGIIGIILMLSAWAITTFVLNAMSNVLS